MVSERPIVREFDSKFIYGLINLNFAVYENICNKRTQIMVLTENFQ